MSTQRAHGHWWDRFLPRRVQPPSTGWATDQNLPIGWKYQHSRPLLLVEPEQPTSVRQRALWAEQLRQLGMHPAMMDQPARAPITPIPETRHTDSIPRLAQAPRENREWADVDTAKKLPMKIALEALADAGLPVRRQMNDLATVRADRESQPVRAVSRPIDLGFADLATWHTPETQDRQVSDAIARIDSARLAWLYDEPPTLAPLDQDALAASDRVAQSSRPEPTPESSAMDELLRHNSITLELPSVTKRIAEKHKESE